MVQFTKYIAAAATVAAFGSNVQAADEIVGGSPAVAGNYPWMVSMASSGRHFCGGSLIAPDVVMTAAHCVSSRTITVRVLGGGVLSSGAENIPVTRQIRHPDYNSGTFDNDVAILLLDRSSSIAPVTFDVTTNTWAGDLARVIGWGTTSAGGSSPSNLLQVDVPVRTNAECDSTAYNGQITDQMVCAGVPEGGIDSCQGDSGGPLFVETVAGNPVVMGVVSWGYGCASRNRYGVYARVNSMLAFLGEYVDVSGNGPEATPEPTTPEATPKPTAPPTDAPPVEEVVCACNGGEGRFESCDTWGYSFNVCLLEYAGNSNNPPPCKVANGGEFLYSNNYRNWYMKGCTKQRRVFPVSPSSSLDLVADDKIVGGEAVESGSYPWMVSLGSNGRHFCGGSLIAPDVVLTAAHCISGRTITARVLGGGLLSSGSENIPVIAQTRHPQYNSASSGYDMAILLLGRSSSITPVKFDTTTELWAEMSSRVIGWGTTSSGGSSPRNLLQVDVPVQTNAECNERSYPGQITPQMVCAGNPEGGKDSCQGDSGGPQFVWVNDEPVVMGIVSWGYGCAARNRYGVYARVNSMLPFMKDFVDVTGVTAPPTEAPTTPPPTTAPPTAKPTTGQPTTRPPTAKPTTPEPTPFPTTAPPTDKPPTNAPTSVGDVVCQCDGGSGRYQTCDTWGYDFTVCLLAYGGDENNPPPCAVVPGGEFVYSNNYSNWYVKGCTKQRQVFAVDPSTVALVSVEAAPTEETPVAADAAESTEGSSPIVAGVVGALAGCFVVLATTFVVLRANKGRQHVVVQDSFSQRAMEPKGNMMVTTEL